MSKQSNQQGAPMALPMTNLNKDLLVNIAKLLKVDPREACLTDFAWFVVGMLQDVNGLSMELAYDKVFGEGSYDLLVRSLQTALKEEQ